MQYAAGANVLAYLALILWPLVCVVLFTQLRPALATSIAFVAAHCILPERLAFDPPILPPLGKESLTSISVYFCVLAVDKSPPLRATSLKVLIGLLILGDFATMVANRDRLHYGRTFVTGLTVNDAIAVSFVDLIGYGAPLAVALRVFKTRQDLLDLLRTLVVAAIAYVPLIAIELRLSPQLNHWVYGFHQHDFVQSVREGGWRPMVFMIHGLTVAKFMSEAIAAAFALGELKQRIRQISPALIGVILLVVLAACSSLAALIYAIVSMLAILFLSAKGRMRLTMVLVGCVGLYPIMRLSGDFPTAPLTALAAGYNAERAVSLDYRFRMENMLLNKAMERSVLGWGGYTRSFVFDNITGKTVSVPDGSWIIELGGRGIFGTVVIFLILAVPVFAARRRFMKSSDTVERSLLASSALVLGISWFDLLPNSGPTAEQMLLAGAVYSLAFRGQAPSDTRLAALVRALQSLRAPAARSQ